MSGSVEHLESEWRKDAARFSSSEAPEIFNNLISRHSEPQRHYHGLSHLSALLALLAKHAPHLAGGSAPRLALWWHDAIYNSTAKDNEDQSAILARDHLGRLGASAALIEDVVQIILITKNHWAGGSTGDGDYFLDADIAILGAPPAVYSAYTAGVRQEYSWAPDDAFRAGRSAFLSKALTWPRLFRTEVFETTYATQARTNMQFELAGLSRSAS
jgi:predicted metal-dependent HD superfamily phosphohydrolase